MALATGLKHLETEKSVKELIENNEKVMVCCGRMGPMCIPVYGVMEELEDKYKDVQFRDMSFDIPDSAIIRSLPECSSFQGLPFVVYYKNGKVVHATSSIQNKKQITEILDANFGKPE